MYIPNWYIITLFFLATGESGERDLFGISIIDCLQHFANIFPSIRDKRVISVSFLFLIGKLSPFIISLDRSRTVLSTLFVATYVCILVLFFSCPPFPSLTENRRRHWLHLRLVIRKRMAWQRRVGGSAKFTKHPDNGIDESWVEHVYLSVHSEQKNTS